MLDGCLPQDRKRAFQGLECWLLAKPRQSSLPHIEMLESSVPCSLFRGDWMSRLRAGVRQNSGILRTDVMATVQNSVAATTRGEFRVDTIQE